MAFGKELTHFYITLMSNASQKLYLSNTLSSFKVHLAQPVNLVSNGRWVVGVCELSCHPYNVGTYANLKVISADTAFIYCDLISPQFVGSQYVEVLRTFIQPSTYCNHTFYNVYYMPVEKRCFRYIEIRLLRSEGRPVGFLPSTMPLKIVLHFRRISLW
jgi:hypothetical protein